jgi:transcriptional regulator with XRE-family HTH domain
MAFNKVKFKGAMREKRITQEEIAAILHKKTRTINEWLSPRVKLNAEQVRSLCEIIDVEPLDFDPDWEGSFQKSGQSRVTAKISNASKNGFWLLKERYGVSEKAIIELAPAMFAIIAEQAKLSGAIWLEKWEALNQQAEANGLPRLYDFYDLEQTANDSVELANEDKIFGIESHDGNPTNPGNLFAVTLKNLCAKSENVEFFHSFFDAGSCPDSIRTTIDRDLVYMLTGGNEELAAAISTGDIQLFGEQFPESKNPQERIEWMNAELVKLKKLQDIKSKKVKKKMQIWRKENPKLAAKYPNALSRLEKETQ